MATGVLPNTIYYGYIDFRMLAGMASLSSTATMRRTIYCRRSTSSCSDWASLPQIYSGQSQTYIPKYTTAEHIMATPLVDQAPLPLSGVPAPLPLSGVGGMDLALNNQPSFSDTSPPPGGMSADDSQEDDGPFGTVVRPFTTTPLAAHIRATRVADQDPPQPYGTDRVSAGPSASETEVAAAVQRAMGPINEQQKIQLTLMQDMQRQMLQFQQTQVRPAPIGPVPGPAPTGPTSRDAGTSSCDDIRRPSAVSFGDDVDQRYRRLKPVNGLVQTARTERSLETEFDSSAQFCSLERSTVALAIFRDNAGISK